MKTLLKREAWLEIAEAYDAYAADGYPSQLAEDGLCRAIDTLAYVKGELANGYIFSEMEEQVKRELDKTFPRKSWLWPPLQKFAKNRADLARKFAEESL